MDPKEVAKRYVLGDSAGLYAIGLFDDGVTVLSQQRRALNLAWSLIESKRIATLTSETQTRVAVIGAGFAGLTFAAALLEKRCNCEITIFEERDALLPLQQGSDTRWLHPHIYDWPEEGSEAAAAMLPVLNWTAARASDVVVQVLANWKDLVSRYGQERVQIYCNTRHIQISGSNLRQSQLEWVGENRQPSDGSTKVQSPDAIGRSADFDIVVLAIGFGLERDNSSSYWRNEILAQPSLGHPRRTFLVSGQGDGAMIDLLRLKISQFRQDRILSELFARKRGLLVALRALRREYLGGGETFPLFEKLESLRSTGVVASEMETAIAELGKRLRRDADLVLKLRVRNVSELLHSQTSRTSFQNALMVYLLYRCGGFAPSSDNESRVVSRFGISKENIVRRHGTNRMEQLQRILPEGDFRGIKKEWEQDRCAGHQQSSDIMWSGGYFGVPGRKEDFEQIEDIQRASWRKEYLPGPTSLFALSIASAVAGLLASFRPQANHFRVTLHRVLPIQDEELLQQSCEYVGRQVPDADTAGRTFPARNATIGAAYQTRRIVRSHPRVQPLVLNDAMGELDLNQASRRMAAEVGFVVAIPILQPETDFFEPSPVCGIVYFDSRDDGFDLSDSELQSVTTVIEEAVENTRLKTERPLNRLQNSALRPRKQSALPREELRPEAKPALMLAAIEPPKTHGAFVFNYDHSDLTPLAP